MLFQDPPMVPREELPEEFHPHRSFYGKLANTMSGVDPTPPEAKRTVAQEMKDLESAVQQQHHEFDEAQGGVSSSNQIMPHNINSEEDHKEEEKGQIVEEVRKEKEEIKEEVKEGEFHNVSLEGQ